MRRQCSQWVACNTSSQNFFRQQHTGSWGRATTVTAACSWVKGSGCWDQRWGDEVFSMLFQFLLQFFLEADGQDWEHSEHTEHSQRVPGHSLTSCGQLVKCCACVDRYKGWRCHSCESARLKTGERVNDKWYHNKIEKKSYREKYQWRRPPKARWWQARWCW